MILHVIVEDDTMADEDVITVDDQDRPEIVIGLVGPVGTDLQLTARMTGDVLSAYGYETPEVIGLSGLLDRVPDLHALPQHGAEYDSYVHTRMNAGNQLRGLCQRGDALAILAVGEVTRRRAAMRTKKGLEDDRPPGGVAYLLRSLKHKNEVESLRRIYRDRFVLIGAHTPRARRLDLLADEIARSKGSTSRREWEAKAHELAQRDEAEELEPFGQDVRGTFPLADFFVDVSNRESGAEELARFFRAFFGYAFATPTPDEYAMFHAAAAAMRSADLSRQVGAAIATERGEIVAVGCNEVPAFGGGSYWIGDNNDQRDFMRGEDANARLRDTAIDEIRRVLIAHEPELVTERLRDMTAEDFRRTLGDTRVDRLTEFNRAVHAEMSAILDAARRGTSVRGATLFSTTFPCHNCAKHLVGAGITRVVYIEPYAKGLAEVLHDDTVAIDRVNRPSDLVNFDQFVGLAPTMYMPIYSMGAKKRKHGGMAVDFSPREAIPVLVLAEDTSYEDREQLAVQGLRREMAVRGIDVQDPVD
jgi:deoxycytidylate deaminase